MRLEHSLSIICLGVLTATPALAQQRAYYSMPAQAPALPARAFTLRDFAKELSASTLQRQSLTPRSQQRTIDSLVVQRDCPMPVARADSARVEAMPVATADTGKRAPMPVARTTCSNPLLR